jgi:uroporphyrinogen decarboxylase
VPLRPRDRVLAALNREVPDRCPLQASFTPEFAARLRADLGLGSGAEHNPHGGGNPYDLELALREDMLLTSVGWANCYYQGDDYMDEWGIRWKSAPYETRFGPGRYTEIAGHPLADAAALDAYRPPDPDRPELYREAARVVREHGPEHWIVGVTVTTIFETAWALRGLDRLLEDLVSDPDLAETILDIPFRFHLAAAKRLAALGVDMIWTGDDVGAQSAMIMSPAMWRRFLKPRMARFFAEVKAVNPRVKIAYHSDGFILPIIPDLIEIGLDVLNPVQPSSMDPEDLKRRYGDKLAFWGSIDEQWTLPFGTPEDVRREVETRLRTLGRGGGLVIGPTHHVQLDTPLENFHAMIDAVRTTACV